MSWHSTACLLLALLFVMVIAACLCTLEKVILPRPANTDLPPGAVLGNLPGYSPTHIWPVSGVPGGHAPVPKGVPFPRKCSCSWISRCQQLMETSVDFFRGSVESVVYKEYEIYYGFMVCSTDLHAEVKKVVADSLEAAGGRGSAEQSGYWPRTRPEGGESG
ncbi:hypothetical protein AVEN_197895-1 [Araneus ventricosus]|uniref:Uncharacterized protein n=1 Tax=Araneus ventricosus TaxID=182803 RepID=A0A4Y2CKL5_ARAVE|nr:hypothetical protein AVEN_197895-1 [Araneus ventricosus]